jgi:hypothetical protein
LTVGVGGFIIPAMAVQAFPDRLLVRAKARHGGDARMAPLSVGCRNGRDLQRPMAGMASLSGAGMSCFCDTLTT